MTPDLRHPLQGPSTDDDWREALKDYCVDRELSYPNVPSSSTCHFLPSLSSHLAESLSLDHDDPGVTRQGEDSAIGQHGNTFQNLVPTGLQAEYAWDDGNSCERERERMKRHYIEHAWLRAPRPSLLLRVRRRKAIRRLGLANDFERSRPVILRVIDLAEDIFKCNVLIVILRATDVVRITSPDRVESRSIENSIESHYCAMSNGEVTVADLQDWRFARHPHRVSTSITAVPLKFRQGRNDVTVGYLSLHDSVDKSNSVLLHLAEILFGASLLMRSIEDEEKGRGRSQIIAITAMSGEADRQRGLLECGMDAWLCKPIILVHQQC